LGAIINLLTPSVPDVLCWDFWGYGPINYAKHLAYCCCAYATCGVVLGEQIYANVWAFLQAGGWIGALIFPNYYLIGAPSLLVGASTICEYIFWICIIKPLAKFEIPIPFSEDCD
jgi:hypothetical protein